MFCHMMCTSLSLYIYTYTYIYGSVRLTSVLLASRKLTIGPGWNPSGHGRKSIDFSGLCFVWGQRVHSQSHRSVSRNHFGPKTLLGRPILSWTAQGQQFWLAARGYIFAVCSARCHPNTSHEPVVYRVDPQFWTCCYPVAPRICFFVYRVNPQYLRSCCK